MILLHELENNRVAIMHPADGIDASDLIAELPAGTEYRIVNDMGSVTDEDIADFQDALRVNFDNSITENYFSWDMDAAKEATKERLRKDRIPLFEANDIALRDAIIANNDADIATYANERDRLRDAPLLADSASTLEQLRNITL